LIELQIDLPLPPSDDHFKETVKCHQTQTDQTTRALLEATRVGQPNKNQPTKNQPTKKQPTKTTNNQSVNQPINKSTKLQY